MTRPPRSRESTDQMSRAGQWWFIHSLVPAYRQDSAAIFAASARDSMNPRPCGHEVAISAVQDVSGAHGVDHFNLRDGQGPGGLPDTNWIAPAPSVMAMFATPAFLQIRNDFVFGLQAGGRKSAEQMAVWTFLRSSSVPSFQLPPSRTTGLPRVFAAPAHAWQACMEWPSTRTTRAWSTRFRSTCSWRRGDRARHWPRSRCDFHCCRRRPTKWRARLQIGD